MSEPPNKTVSNGDRYPSFAALRDAHRELLRSDREMTDRMAFLDRVEEFCERAYATGTLLDADEDRRASQSLLNYWVATLYGDDRTPANTILADFDMSAVQPIEDAACPYPGSRAFREADTKNFFGRQTAIDYVLNRLKVDRMLALIGPSGRGKTSVVLAGILPALRIYDDLSSLKRFYFPVLIPGSDPLGSLGEMIDVAREEFAEAAGSTRSLLRDPDYLLEAINKTTDLPAVIVVDQFDDLFTLSDDREQQRAFLMSLLKVVQAPEPKHTVIFTMRSDTYDDRIEKLSSQFSELFTPAKWVLPPLGADEIGDAIRKPAEKVGLKIAEPAVLSLIKEILNEPIGLPLLQFALQKLWAKRDVNTVSEKAFKELGSCRVAYIRAAEELYAELNEDEKSTARNILMKLVKVDEDNHVTVIPVLRANLLKGDQPEHVESVLQRLIKAGLVRLTENKEQDIQVELVHDSLIRSWNEMAAWVGSRKSRLQTYKYAVRAVLALLVLAGVVAIAVAFVNSREDQRRKLSHSVANRSSELLKTRNHNLALLLGRHAYLLSDDAQTRGSVLNLLWETPRPLRFLFKTQSETRGVAFSSDNKHLATFDEQGKVSIWNLESEPSLEKHLPTSERASYPLVFSPDGKMLAWTSNPENNQPVSDSKSNITLWKFSTDDASNSDGSNGTATHLFVDEAYRVESIAFSPQSNVLITGGIDGRVFRWDLATKSPELLGKLSGYVKSIRFDSQGKWLACGNIDGSVVLWNPETRELDPDFAKQEKRKREQADLPEEELSLSFSPDGKRLVIDRFTGTTVWDLVSKPQKIIADALPGSKRISAFNEDGKTLISYYYTDSTIRTLVLEDINDPKQIPEHPYRKVEAPTIVAFSRDGKILAVPRNDGITLWDIRQPLVASAGIDAIAFSPTSNNDLAASLSDGRIVLWNTVDGTIENKGLLSQQNRPVQSLAFNPDGKTLALGLLKSVIFWDLTKGAQVGEPTELEGSLVLSLVYRPDGQILAAVNDDSATLTLWNVVQRERVKTPPQQDTTVESAAFDSSGMKLAIAYKDGTVRIWNVNKLDNITQEGPAITPGVTISKMAFSVDGKLLAFVTKAAGDNVIIWDVESNTQIGDGLGRYNNAALSVAFRSDGAVLASSGDDKTLALWDMAVKAGADQFCWIANTNLSRKEWDTYIGEDKEYCRICEKNPPGKDAADAPVCNYPSWSFLR